MFQKSMMLVVDTCLCCWYVMHSPEGTLEFLCLFFGEEKSTDTRRDRQRASGGLYGGA